MKKLFFVFSELPSCIMLNFRYLFSLFYCESSKFTNYLITVELSSLVVELNRNLALMTMHYPFLGKNKKRNRQS